MNALNAVEAVSPTVSLKAEEKTLELVEAVQDVLAQGLTLLFELGDGSYSRSQGAPYNASIGQHYGHLLEPFQNLVLGLRAGEINYDARQRSPRLESDVTYACIATCDVLRALKRFTEETLRCECKVIQNTANTFSRPSFINSNVSRELAYCVRHVIHHFSIIRLICNETDIRIPREFGVGPSMLRDHAVFADQGQADLFECHVS